MTTPQTRQPHPYDAPDGRQRFLAAEILSIVSFLLMLGGMVAAFTGSPAPGVAAVLVAVAGSFLAQYLRRQSWELTPGAQGRRSWDAPMNPARLIRPTTNSLLLGLIAFTLMARTPDSGPLFLALATFTGITIGRNLTAFATRAMRRAALDWPHVLISLSAPVLVLAFVLIGEPIASEGWALPYAIAGAFLGVVAATAVNTLRPAGR